VDLSQDRDWYQALLNTVCRAMAHSVSCWHRSTEHMFAPSSVHVGFVVGKVELRQIFLSILQFYPVNIIPTELHTYISPGE
jgi:hypothetical protein